MEGGAAAGMQRLSGRGEFHWALRNIHEHFQAFLPEKVHEYCVFAVCNASQR
jgi:hypothetical protein